jgi:NMT1/THI5 like
VRHGFASRFSTRFSLNPALARYPLLLKNLGRFTLLNLFLAGVAAISWLSSKGGIYGLGVSWSEAIALIAFSWIALPAFIGRFSWSEQRARKFMLVAYAVGLSLLALSILGRELSSAIDRIAAETPNSASPSPTLSSFRALQNTANKIIAPVIFFLSALILYAFLIHAHRAVLFKVSIRLRWHHQAQFAGIYMAKAERIFEKNGLDVKIEERDPQRLLANLVGAGDNEFGIAMAPEVVRMRSEGRELIPIEILSLASPLEMLINPDTALKRIEAKQPVRILTVEHFVEDKIIGSFLTNIYRGDVKPKIKTSYYSDNHGASDFLEGKYDGIVVHCANEKIFLQHAMSTNNWVSLKILNTEHAGLALLGETLLTNHVVATQHPEVVEAMKRAVILGWELAGKHSARAAALSLQYRRRSQFAEQLGADWKRELPHQKSMLGEMLRMFECRKEFRARQTEGIWNQVIRSCIATGIVAEDCAVTAEDILGLPKFDLRAGGRDEPGSTAGRA